SGTVSQTITVRDNTPPTISAAGANATINCPATPVFTPPTATDTCDPSPDIVVVSDVTTPGTCAGTYSETKTWKAVDACNNSSGTVSQTRSEERRVGKASSAAGANATINCQATPVFTPTPATDTC